MNNALAPLHQLADAYGLELFYHDDQGRRCDASPPALLAVLKALGAGIDRIGQAGDVLRARRQAQWQLPVEPVVVAWNGTLVQVPLRLPARGGPARVSARFQFESGEVRESSVATSDLPLVGDATVEGVAYRVVRLTLHGPLPLGYHRLTLDLDGRTHECLVLAAPDRAYEPPGGLATTWGGFLPLYAVRSTRNWGVGDFTDLENLIGWVQGLGGGIVGTLPLLAALLDEPYEPSPYSPASRLFWNEFYLDVERIPELRADRGAQELIASSAFRAAVAAQHAQELVDYKGQMALKRQVLERLAARFFADPAGRNDAFRRFVADHPRVEDYARFRATGERLRTSWWKWPDRLRDGDLRQGDWVETAERYHLYVQWQADEQLRHLSERAAAKGPGLYLDYPLGVNPDGYDVWRDRSAFAPTISAGAPPDSFFTLGQDWGFPPLHPEAIRADGYRYLRDCLQHHMQYAGMLRIDHMMGLHRFFWVPPALGPRHGVYVRYQADELYAVWSLESVRHRTMLVGEDLGTVPPEVRPAMERHNFRRLYVGQYEARPDGNGPLGQPVEGSVAGLNTHDMPPFAAFWDAFDLEDRQALGLVDDAGRLREEERRSFIRDSVIYFLRNHGLLGEETDTASVLKGLLQSLGATRAAVVLANLEDLWQAKLPQNCPGTWRERPNWLRKARHAIEQFDTLPKVRETLLALDRARREEAGK